MTYSTLVVMVNTDAKVIILYDFFYSSYHFHKHTKMIEHYLLKILWKKFAVACWGRALGFLRFNLFGDTIQKNMQGTKLVREYELKCTLS